MDRDGVAGRRPADEASGSSRARVPSEQRGTAAVQPASCLISNTQHDGGIRLRFYCPFFKETNK